MLPPLEYLSWAQRHYPTIEYDLASSGLREVPLATVSPDQAMLGSYRGMARFRELLAERYRVTVPEIALTLGTSGALYVAYTALFDRGDEVVIEDPAYEPVVRVAEGAGLVIRKFPRRRDAAYAVSIDDVLAAVTDRTRGVVITDLHNPTGVALDHDVVRELAKVLASRGIMLLVDEVYAELAAPRRTARSLGENVVTLSSLTKCFGLGWARAGFVLATPALISRIEQTTLHVAGGLPTSVGAFGAAALSRVTELETRRTELQQGKRAVVDAWLDKHKATLSWVPPHAGSLFGLVHDARGGDLRARLEAGARNQGVLAAAGVFFGAPSAFRLGMALPREKLAEALRRLEVALDL